MMARPGAAVPCRAQASFRLGLPHRIGCIALFLAALSMVWVIPYTTAFAAVPEGVWLIDGKAAVQIFDCSGQLCGRMLWLQTPRNPQGQLSRDRNNPDPALRQRGLCGLTVLWRLRSSGRNHWEGGWFYNPDTGKTYQVSAELRSANQLVARIYVGLPIFGESKTLVRVPHGVSDGWC